MGKATLEQGYVMHFPIGAENPVGTSYIRCCCQAFNSNTRNWEIPIYGLHIFRFFEFGQCPAVGQLCHWFQVALTSSLPEAFVLGSMICNNPLLSTEKGNFFPLKNTSYVLVEFIATSIHLWWDFVAVSNIRSAENAV